MLGGLCRRSARSHLTTKAAGAGGRRGPRAQAGAGWQSRTQPPARAHGRASAKGAQRRRCRLAMAARPASRPCLAGGSRAQRPPARSHADPPQGSGDRRGGGGGGGDGGGTAAYAAAPQATPRRAAGKAPSPLPPQSYLLAVTWGCCAHSTAKPLQPLKPMRLKDTGSSRPCSPRFWKPGPPGAALPHTTGAGRAGRGQAGVKPPSPAVCSQRKYEVPESSTPICQGASQAFKCRDCPGSACAGTAAPAGQCGQHSLPAGPGCGEGPGPGTGARWEPSRRDNALSGTRGR